MAETTMNGRHFECFVAVACGALFASWLSNKPMFETLLVIAGAAAGLFQRWFVVVACPEIRRWLHEVTA